MPTLGAARAITCPACGVGQATGLCTLTRGEVETLVCDLCTFYLRNGIVLERGVVLNPDDVVEFGRRRAPFAPDAEIYLDLDRRPVRLVASGLGGSVDGAALPPMTSLTIRFARPRPTR